MSNASTEWLKKSAFKDELTNRLLLLPASEVDEETLTVVRYLKKRVEEIERLHG
jgi:hypothetical protein